MQIEAHHSRHLSGEESEVSSRSEASCLRLCCLYESPFPSALLGRGGVSRLAADLEGRRGVESGYLSSWLLPKGIIVGLCVSLRKDPPGIALSSWLSLAIMFR